MAVFNDITTVRLEPIQYIKIMFAGTEGEETFEAHLLEVDSNWRLQQINQTSGGMPRLVGYTVEIVAILSFSLVNTQFDLVRLNNSRDYPITSIELHLKAPAGQESGGYLKLCPPSDIARRRERVTIEAESTEERARTTIRFFGKYSPYLMIGNSPPFITDLSS